MKRLFSLVVALVFILGGMATVSAYEDILPGDAYGMLNPYLETGEPNPNYIPDAYILDVKGLGDVRSERAWLVLQLFNIDNRFSRLINIISHVGLFPG